MGGETKRVNQSEVRFPSEGLTQNIILYDADKDAEWKNFLTLKRSDGAIYNYKILLQALLMLLSSL